ncbi:hypothetical protein ACRV3X_10445 [Clostridioides difficile]
MKIKKIILGLDNLENVELGIGDVGGFYLDNIHEIIGGFALSYIGKCKKADYLHIVISKDKTVEEVFNEEFEDDEEVEFSFKMYGI